MNLLPKFPFAIAQRVVAVSTMLVVATGAATAAIIAPNYPPDLSSAPPDVSVGVNPNIFVTLDDSGSMTSNYMGDTPPYGTNASWSGNPWFSANVVDPDHAGSAYSDAALRRLNLNGVYYNPKTNYVPPLKEDGSSFNVADATLKNVYRDGIAINRPWKNVAAAATTQQTVNPGSGGSANDNYVDNLMGTVTDTTSVVFTYKCTTTDKGETTGGATPSPIKGACLNVATSYSVACTATGTSCTNNSIKYDNRWFSGKGDSPTNGTTGTSPMDGLSHTLSDGTVVTYGPAQSGTCGSAITTATTSNGKVTGYTTTVTCTRSTGGGGPYYWRYKTLCSVAPNQYNCAPAWSTSIANEANGVNKYGIPTGADLTALYNANNWEAVPVPQNGTVNNWQNFANWYSYYRTRTQMARTALSRVFGVIGTPQKANIRVSWQNLGLASQPNWQYSSNGTSAIANTQIVELDDSSNLPTGAPYNGDSAATNKGWRQAFFNWIYNTGASTTTPSLHAMMRVGDFFTKGKSTYNLTNPYYQPGGDGKNEVACRQNYHMFVTDGFYNETAPNNSNNTNNPWTLPANPSGITSYSATNAVSKIYAHSGWSTDQSNGSAGAYSDVAFYYWATNLRPDFSTVGSTTYTTDTVAPYFPNLTTGVTATATTVNASNPGATPEVFWNPANDPATWPHLVQFAVTLGAYGKLVNSSNTDCQNGATSSSDDGCALRKGASPLSNGGTTWPQPNSNGGNDPGTVDDLWHAALNSRGQFFVATNPQTLINRLTKIIASIVARSGSSVSESVNSSILNQGSVAYQGGYNSSGWVGYLYKQNLDPNTGAPLGNPSWDAGCLLTGGACTATGSTGTARTPGSRKLFTSTGWPGTLTGAPFQWASLGTNEQLALNLDPTTTWPDTTTGSVVSTSGVANGTQDANGQDRVSYLRGVRKNETVATSSPTNPTVFRPRNSVLGAIIDSQAVYEGAPSAAWQDIYPVGSPEQVAAAAGNTYEKFVKTNLTRNPMVYVGANDGILHAFDAGTGDETWGYVPNALYANGQLTQMTNPTTGSLVVSVDDSPVVQDVFIGGQWKTILVGGLRLGGRGVYMLDVTDTSAPADEATAAGKFKWEFTSTQDPDLGYSYATANIARISCNVAPCHGAATGAAPTGGTWVVLVTSGDFPVCLPAASGSSTCVANGHSATDTAVGATPVANAKTYLWVLNADDGSLIRKIPTKAGVTSYGLSTPSVADFGSNQIDDVVVAGDLAGNLWRFDLSDTNPTQWDTKVDLMFQTYANTTACGTGNVNGIGCEPITVMPVAFPDSVTGSVVWVFGSGQYLGASDNSTSSTPATQHFFGVRDYGQASPNYPILEANLNTRALTQDSAGNRSLSLTATTVANPRGWMIPLNVSGVLGERNVATASPLYSAGIALLTSLIPGQNSDPCVPGRSGAVIAIDASSGGPPLSAVAAALVASASAQSALVGFTVSNPPAVGGLSLISMLGGGKVILPGMQGPAGTPPQLNGLTPVWRRSSWNELLNWM